MKIDYNVDKDLMKHVRPLPEPSEEIKTIMDFMDSDNENIQFTYDTEEEARKRRLHIMTQCRNRGIGIRSIQRLNVVIVARKPEVK